MHILKILSSSDVKFTRKLMISYSLLLLVILFIGLYLYNMTKISLREDVETQTQIQMRNAVANMDNDINAMQGFALSLVKNFNISKLARTDLENTNEFYRTAYAAQNSINVYTPTQSLLPVSSYFIHFNKSGYILSPTQFTSMDNYYKTQYMSEEHYGQWQDTLKNENQYMHFLSLNKYNSRNNDYFYIIPLDTYIFYQIPAELILIISHSKVDQLFSTLNLQQGSCLYVTDTDGQVQFTLNADNDQNLTSSLSSLSYKNDIASIMLEGEKMVVIKQDSEVNHWSYFYLLPEQTLYYSLDQYRNMFLVVMIAGLTIGIFLLYILSCHNVRPYIQLGNQLKDSLVKSEELQSTLDEQKPLLRNSYIRSLMLGRISSKDEMDYIKNFLSLTANNRTYIVLYIATYPSEDQTSLIAIEEQTQDGTLRYNNANLYDQSILTSLQKNFKTPMYLFYPKKHNYSVLLSFDKQLDRDAIYHEISSLFDAFHDEVLHNESIWTIGGLGGINHQLENTWKSYQQASEAVSYASNENILRFYNELNLTSSLYYYPPQLAESLSNFITAGNLDQVKEIFKFIYKENIEKRMLSFPKMQSLLMELYSTLSKIRFSISDEDVDKSIKALDTNLKEYLSLKQLEDVATSLCRFFVGKTSQKQIIQRIKKYIQANYKDSSLCLSKLSDQFHLSESYLSFLFKEVTNENFSNYLEQIRMEKALQLVQAKNINLSDIYFEVGYNNANSFRRVFKKTYGMSAKELRTSNQLGHWVDTAKI